MKQIAVIFFALSLTSCALVEDFFSVDLTPDKRGKETAYAVVSDSVRKETKKMSGAVLFSEPFLTVCQKSEK